MLWWVGLAMAAEPPTGGVRAEAEPVTTRAPTAAPANLEDIDHWTEGADRLLDGPPGCWEIVGRATWAYEFGRLAENRGDALFVGRLEDGVWTGFTVMPLGEVSRIGKKPAKRFYVEEQRFVPLLGRLGGGSVTVSNGDDTVKTEVEEGDSDPSNVLREAMDELGGDTEVAWTEWDPAVGVLLHRAAPVGGGKRAPEATTLVRFPGGGPVPDAMNVDFPPAFHTRGLPRVRVRNARVRVRADVVDGHAFPTREAFRFEASVLTFSGSGAQTIVYQHVNACAE